MGAEAVSAMGGPRPNPAFLRKYWSPTQLEIKRGEGKTGIHCWPAVINSVGAEELAPTPHPHPMLPLSAFQSSQAKRLAPGCQGQTMSPHPRPTLASYLDYKRKRRNWKMSLVEPNCGDICFAGMNWVCEVFIIGCSMFPLIKQCSLDFAHFNVILLPVSELHFP